MGGALAWANEPSSLALSGSPCLPAWTPFPDDASDLAFMDAAVGSDGFVYIGGSEAVHRLEGARTRSWYPDPSTPGALPAGNVAAIVSYDDGFWLGTDAGLVWFDAVHSLFELVPFTEDGSGGLIRTLRVQYDRLLIGTDKGAFYLDLTDTSHFGAIRLAGVLDQPRVEAFVNFQGRLVAATSAGLYAADSDLVFKVVDLESDSPAPHVMALAVDADETLWLGTSDGLVRVSSLEVPSSTRYAHSSTDGIPEGPIEALSVDSEGTLWFGGWGGLSRWRADASTPETCRRSGAYDSDVSLPVTLLYTAREGLLIMGTRGARLRIAQLTTDVRRVVTGEPAFGDLPEVLVYSTLLDRQGRLVIGASRGLFRERDANGGSFEPIGGEALATRRIQALFETEDASLWVGTNSGLFRIIDGRTEQHAVLKSPATEAGNEFIFSIRSFGDLMLVGMRRGLIVLDAETATPVRLFSASPDVRTINELSTNDALSHGGVWHVDVMGQDVYATDRQDVYRIDVERGTILASTVEGRGAGVFKSGRRNGAVATSDGEVFIATDNGIIRTDRNFSDAEYITTLNGFRIAAVLNARRNTDGVVWFSSILGLFGFDSGADKWQKLTIEDGVHSRGMTQGALSFGSNGWLVGGSGEGVSVLPLEKTTSPKPEFALVAMNARTNQRLPDGHRIDLGPDDRSITIQFATPGFTEDGRYAIDYEFSSSKANTSERLDFGESLSFQQLEHGEYRLQAQMVDIAGFRSPPITIDLLVKPYWWETELLYAPGFLIGLLLVAVSFSLRSRTVRRRYELLSDERSRIAQEMHDTFIQDLIGARMLQRTVLRNISSKSVKEKAEQVLALLSTATDDARQKVTAMDIGDLSKLPPLSDALRMIDPPSRLERPVPVGVKETGTPWRVGPQRCFFLLRIVQEAVNNACKHARATEIVIALNWRRFGVLVEVTDDGLGFVLPDALESGGFGLGAMRRMAAAGRARLAIKSEVGAGTKVRVEARRFWI